MVPDLPVSLQRIACRSLDHLAQKLCDYLRPSDTGDLICRKSARWQTEVSCSCSGTPWRQDYLQL